MGTRWNLEPYRRERICAQNLIDLFQCYLPRRSQIPFTTFWVVWFSERHTESEHRLLRCQVKKTALALGPYHTDRIFEQDCSTEMRQCLVLSAVRVLVLTQSLFRVWTDHD